MYSLLVEDVRALYNTGALYIYTYVYVLDDMYIYGRPILYEINESIYEHCYIYVCYILTDKTRVHIKNYIYV